jgi:hypothetical protein
MAGINKINFLIFPVYGGEYSKTKLEQWLKQIEYSATEEGTIYAVLMHADEQTHQLNQTLKNAGKALGNRFICEESAGVLAQKIQSHSFAGTVQINSFGQHAHSCVKYWGEALANTLKIEKPGIEFKLAQKTGLSEKSLHTFLKEFIKTHNPALAENIANHPELRRLNFEHETEEDFLRGTRKAFKFRNAVRKAKTMEEFQQMLKEKNRSRISARIQAIKQRIMLWLRRKK